MDWRERILRTLPLREPETWVEIGPGHGEMTELLAGGGRRVVAIETDAALAEGLRQRAPEWPGIEIVEADALTVDFAKLTDGPFRIYGNLPYYITSPLLHNFFRAANRIRSIHIVIQLEVAERITANPGTRDYGYLSVLCQLYTKPRIVFRIPPGAFRPPPLVTSALVAMELPGDRAGLDVQDEGAFLEFVQRCFSQKRKTLRNNLRSIADSGRIDSLLHASGVSQTARAEELSVAELAKLYAEWSIALKDHC